ncbi:MAG TPA: ABC transporter ATP-binding protein [Bacteroidales bacterium]|nr:ABC transporter ATP-binding protein [Bacteroidales bacterium]
MIKVSNIHKSFGSVKVLKGIDLEIKKGELVAIVGASGAGKTTLLQIMGTLSSFDKGEIIIHNTNIKTLKDSRLSKFRNQNIGFVFQFHYLLPEFTALENVSLPLLIQRQSRTKAEAKAKEILSYLNLSHRLTHKPHQLSGGEQQRTAIARALITNPSVILADEPTGNLDSRNTQEIINLLKDLQQNMNQTIVIVTHNMELANATDKIFSIRDGKIIN